MMPSFDVSPAQPNDLSLMIELDGFASSDARRRDYLERAVRAHGSLIARDRADAVGFALWDQSFYGYDFLALLTIEHGSRRLEIASALLAAVEIRCRTGKLFTSTSASNVEMQRLAEHLGFARSGKIDHLNDFDAEFVYFKRLFQEDVVLASMMEGETAASADNA